MWNNKMVNIHCTERCCGVAKQLSYSAEVVKMYLLFSHKIAATQCNNVLDPL